MILEVISWLVIIGLVIGVGIYEDKHPREVKEEDDGLL